MFYNAQNCPQKVQTQLKRLVAEIAEVSSNNLVGVYLHGSLAMGCFNPHCSDIDILVRLHETMTVEAKRQLGETLLELSGNPCPIEISFLASRHIFPWRHPAPYDFHYSEAWRDNFICALSSGEWQQWNDEIWVDADLAAHLMMCAERGICLKGFDIPDAFPAVPASDFRDSILGDVLSQEFGLGSDFRRPVYVVLNACRALAYLQQHLLLSKAEGALWALKNLPHEDHAVIYQVLSVYEGESNESEVSLPSVRLLARRLDKRIRGAPQPGL